MSAADFLLSPEVQHVLKVTYAEPARQFLATELAKLTRLEADRLASTLAHLVGAGILSASDGEGDAATRYGANTSFVFYPELRRMALKSFAVAEPLRQMLRKKFRESVWRAFLLGEDEAKGTASLLIVHGASCPDKDALDAALRKLLKSGALRQHLDVQVIPHRRFMALDPHAGLGARVASGSCIEVLAPTDSRATLPEAPLGLIAKARQRLSMLAP